MWLHKLTDGYSEGSIGILWAFWWGSEWGSGLRTRGIFGHVGEVTSSKKAGSLYEHIVR